MRLRALLIVAFVFTSVPVVARADGSELVNAFSITQPLAHAQDLMRLPGLARLLDRVSGKSGGGPSIADMQMGLVATAPFWPRELAIGMPSSGFAQVGGLGRTFMLASLCKGAVGAGARGKKELPTLQKALATELKTLRLPPLVITATYADAGSAKQVAAALVDLLRPSLAESSVKMTTAGEASGVQLKLGRFFTPAETKAMLVSLAWLSGPRDPQAKALGAALAALEAQAWIAVEGTTVVITLGPRLPGKAPVLPAPPVRLAPGTLLATARAEIKPLRAMVADLQTLWAKWEGSAAAARTRADDDTDMLGDLPRLARDLARWGDRREGWLWVDRGAHALYREIGAPRSTPLASEPIAALLPADAVAVDVDARDNLGDRFSNAFERIEDRMARRSFAETMNGVEGGKAEKLELAYYKNFAKLRELVHDKGPKVFAGGSALVIGPGARIGRLEVRGRPGAPARTSKNVSVPELAWIGRAPDAKTALAFVADLWAAFGVAVSSAMNGQAAATPAALTDAPPPAAGATARWLDTSWFDAMVNEQVSADGGFKPQVAVQGNTVVLSTSPALTQKILALGAGAPAAKGRMALPASKAPLLAWARYPCAPLAAQLRAALAASDAISERALNFGTKASPTSTKDIGDIASLVCDVVDGVTLSTTEEGGATTTTVEMPAAAALYRAGKK
jgi:hypothetical protein